MTATLAEHCTRDAAHMTKVRAEYDHTKTGHALPDGCGVCGVGFVEGRSTGWDYDPDGTPTMCGPCIAEGLRHAAQMAGSVTERTVCNQGLHDLTDTANHYWALNGRKVRVLRCKPCYRRASAESKKRGRARKVAEL